MAVLDRSCRACFYVLRELAIRDRPGGPLLAVFDTYCANPSHDGGEEALMAAYRIAPPEVVRMAQESVVAKGLMPPGTYIPPNGGSR
jgi:hypothetical protein